MPSQDNFYHVVGGLEAFCRLLLVGVATLKYEMLCDSTKVVELQMNGERAQPMKNFNVCIGRVSIYA